MAESQKLLIFEEKHGDTYYVINEHSDRFKVALDVLRRRYHEHYYPPRSQIQQEYDNELEILTFRFGPSVRKYSPESPELDVLPDDIKKALLSNMEEYSRSLALIERDYENGMRFVNYLEELLDEPDEEKALSMTVEGTEANLAWRLLCYRISFQYEGFTETETTAY